MITEEDANIIIGSALEVLATGSASEEYTSTPASA